MANSMSKSEIEIKTRRIKMTVAYDGTAYHGWQVQPDRPSIQQVLEEVTAGVVSHPVKIHGSGRTDRGVHARGQIAHLDITTRIADTSLIRAINARLPTDIRVMKLITVSPTFHARRSAHGKEYRYFVEMGQNILPDRRLYATHTYHALDVQSMAEAASFFVGTHDFAAFTANPQREIETTVRTIYDFRVSKKGSTVTFAVRGNGFLYKQVRSMVGFLLRVGQGAEKPSSVQELLESAKPRIARVPSAPPQGLFLWKVWYTGRQVESQGKPAKRR